MTIVHVRASARADVTTACHTQHHEDRIFAPRGESKIIVHVLAYALLQAALGLLLNQPTPVKTRSSILVTGRLPEPAISRSGELDVRRVGRGPRT